MRRVGGQRVPRCAALTEVGQEAELNYEGRTDLPPETLADTIVRNGALQLANLSRTTADNRVLEALNQVREPIPSRRPRARLTGHGSPATAILTRSSALHFESFTSPSAPWRAPRSWRRSYGVRSRWNGCALLPVPGLGWPRGRNASM